MCVFNDVLMLACGSRSEFIHNLLSLSYVTGIFMIATLEICYRSISRMNFRFFVALKRIIWICGRKEKSGQNLNWNLNNMWSTTHVRGELNVHFWMIQHWNLQNSTFKSVPWIQKEHMLWIHARIRHRLTIRLNTKTLPNNAIFFRWNWLENRIFFWIRSQQKKRRISMELSSM